MITVTFTPYDSYDSPLMDVFAEASHATIPG